MRLRLVLTLTTAALIAIGTVPALGDPGHGHGHGHGHGNGGGPGGHGKADCEAARCSIAAAIEQACPCDAATNHGSYVSCVAHARKTLAASGVIPRRCKGRIVSCAARSTCGMGDAVACRVPVATCNAASGTCVNDPATSCAADADCGTRCTIVASTDACQTSGGTPSGSGSCCAECTTTSTTSSTSSTTSTSTSSTTTTVP